MDDDTTQAAWHQLELEQREQWERWQETLKADPAYTQWLEIIDLMNRLNERTHNEIPCESIERF